VPEGADRLLVSFVLVRRLLLSAKCLVLAAKQLFLAAKHAVACMSQPRVRFQRELWARQPGYTLWTMSQQAVMASCRNGSACRYRTLPALAW
jgi:hypothetical protein